MCRACQPRASALITSSMSGNLHFPKRNEMYVLYIFVQVWMLSVPMRIQRLTGSFDRCLGIPDKAVGGPFIENSLMEGCLIPMGRARLRINFLCAAFRSDLNGGKLWYARYRRTGPLIFRKSIAHRKVGYAFACKVMLYHVRKGT